MTPFRRLARDLRRELSPTPEQAVLRELERRAHREPRRTAGSIAIAPYDFAYVDAMTTWPQWDEIFIHDVLAFEPSRPRPRILDCGANVGIASMYFARSMPDASITAFEADPHIAGTCARNMKPHGVEVVAAAVWTSTGTTQFVCEGSDAGAVASLNITDGPVAAVPCVRLRDYLCEPIDLLKLDIEGAELQVLEDCGDALGCVRALTLDLHEFDPRRRQTSRVFDLLETAGFQFELHSVAPVGQRAGAIPSPFRDASSAWASTVRAWR